MDLVAHRMRLTLIEVLGEARGRTLYTLEWLQERVRWHLDPEQCTGRVLLADSGGDVLGHTIVRLDEERSSTHAGLFSTIYVAPEARGRGIATQLLLHGERWLARQGARESATHTAEWNERLIRLFEGQGYRIAERFPTARMVRLCKAL